MAEDGEQAARFNSMPWEEFNKMADAKYERRFNARLDEIPQRRCIVAAFWRRFHSLGRQGCARPAASLAAAGISARAALQRSAASSSLPKRTPVK